MNREAGAVQHVKSPPRADRLRFVGQADCEASLRDLPRHAWYSLGSPMPPGRHEQFMRTLSLMRTLATDKERI